MFTRIEALNYRSLRWVSQDLDPFHVLVGPNASGKTTFLDVPAFLSDLLNDGLEEAVRRRSSDPRDLLHFGRGDAFELAVEAEVPSSGDSESARVRYELKVSLDPHTSEPGIDHERLAFLKPAMPIENSRTLFPECRESPNSLMDSKRSGKHILSKSAKGPDSFFPKDDGKKSPKSGNASHEGRTKRQWVAAFRLGPRRSALGNLPEDPNMFPEAIWFKNALLNSFQKIALDSLAMRRPSPPGQPTEFKPDGTNLPWVLEHLKTKHPDVFADWLEHLRVGLPEIEDIDTVLREEDRHRYLRIAYAGGDGFKVPSWMVSDGTLRLIALTVAAYLPDLRGCLLIEEPENGIHPKAVETMYQSLSHVYDAQVLTATHSPMILSLADPARVLCFAKDESGATDIVRGDRHPMLVDWQRDVSLGTLFAAGVLG